MAATLLAGAGAVSAPAQAATQSFRTPAYDLVRAYVALRADVATMDDVRVIARHATNGDPTAIEVVAWLYADGRLIGRNNLMAFEWYLRAFMSRVPNALANARAVYRQMTPQERQGIDPAITDFVFRQQGFEPPVTAVDRPERSPDREAIVQIIREEAELTGVPIALARAVAKVESNFRADAISSAGARGVMQIMPSTAMGEFGVGAESLWDARTNVRLGIRFLESLINRYGSVDIALSHYNGGSAVGRPGNARVLPWTQDYVNLVLGWQRFYSGEATDPPLYARRAAGGGSAALPGPVRIITPTRTPSPPVAEPE
ncbi:lytic transglycosylase domain-containing protein [Zavarzinia sp. CC-PAN008]|uniref:lytic transglycosylase domain-containing protein n=1 Tax=Zavarzinia sp. CC-PAN008 TaxID=3243332 RepID=UPI003F7486A2